MTNYTPEFRAYVAKKELRQVAGVLKRAITRSYRKKLAELKHGYQST
jgi:hypothetical protein